MTTIERKIIEELKKPQDKKERYNFTLSKSTKDGLAAWCKENGLKESTALDMLIKKVLPEKFFKK
jgi:hypothetical protein